jgi:magnesium transporter
MLETYFLKFQDLENDITRFTKEMDNTQKILNINLLTQRNLYAIFQTYISMLTFSLSFGSFIGSMYGMNLNNHLEDYDNSFYFLFSFCICSMVFIYLFQIFFFKKYNKTIIHNQIYNYNENF